jgi:ABC-type lipoprotein release transport system permease subunit
MIWTAIAEPSNVLVQVDVSGFGLVLVVAGIAIVAGLASIWPGRRAARLRPAAVLRSE